MLFKVRVLDRVVRLTAGHIVLLNKFIPRTAKIMKTQVRKIVKFITGSAVVRITLISCRVCGSSLSKRTSLSVRSMLKLMNGGVLNKIATTFGSAVVIRKKSNTLNKSAKYHFKPIPAILTVISIKKMNRKITSKLSPVVFISWLWP